MPSSELTSTAVSLHKPAEDWSSPQSWTGKVFVGHYSLMSNYWLLIVSGRGGNVFSYVLAAEPSGLQTHGHKTSLTFRNISNIGQQQLRITKRLILTYWRASVLTEQKVSLLYVYTKRHVCSEMTVLPIRRNSHLWNWSFCPYEVCHLICWWLLGLCLVGGALLVLF